jgi:chitin disaccharide deacetylase
MVRWPHAQEAATYARHTNLGLGLHFDVGEWVYLDGEWQPVYEVVPTESADAVPRELAAQLDRFERLVGEPPDHLDSHQHVHRKGPARRALVELGKRLGVPVREVDAEVAYNGAFFGHDGKATPVPEAITVDALIELIEGLPPGITELACHPATAVDHDSVYAHERVREVETLCDPRVRTTIERLGISLRSFGDVRATAS